MSLELARLLVELATAVAVVGAGIWAVFQYRKARRAAAGQWVASAFRDFYLEPKLVQARRRFEENYSTDLQPLIQSWVRHPSGTLKRNWDFEAQEDLDVLFNYLELVGHLNKSGEVQRREVESLFDYWIAEIGSRSRPELGLYLNVFGYESLADLVWKKQEKSRLNAFKCLTADHGEHLIHRPSARQLENPHLLAVYGSLDPSSGQWAEFEDFANTKGVSDASTMIRRISDGSVQGVLDLSTEYPRLLMDSTPTDSTPIALMAIQGDPERALKVLDAWEEFNPAKARPGYRRIFAPVKLECQHTECLVGAWVYEWHS